ncbi:MAG: dTDP-4-dehydrorhamnose 3,5-epimerase [Bacteroidota bacterium]
MKLEKTNLPDCVVVKPSIYKDERGSFFESFHQQEFARLYGKEIHFVQDNQSISQYGTIRGLHWQTGDFEQAKLVRVAYGEVLDVAVDLRPNSPTFGKHHSMILNDQNNYQLFVPRGFAHGFATLSEKAIFVYKCDNYYHKNSESGIYFKDKDLNIDWKIPESDCIISEKDQQQASFKSFLK